MRLVFIVFLILFQCSQVKNKRQIQFDPFLYLQQRHDLFSLNVDTLLYFDAVNRMFRLQVHFKDSCKSLFYIFKSNRVRNAVMDSILPTCTTEIAFVGLDDNLKKPDVKRPVRARYSLHSYNDSVVYELIWKGPLKNKNEIAQANLFLLKNYMSCRNKDCADPLIDSLRKMCIEDYCCDD